MLTQAKEALSKDWMAEQDREISEAVGREQARLKNFIRKRVPDESDAEDILQEVFYELVEASRVMKPVEQVGAWLFRVARNRIIDLFRKKKSAASIRGAGASPARGGRASAADVGGPAALPGRGTGSGV